MRYLHLFCGTGAERAIINIVGDLPQFTRDVDAAAWHAEQARILVDALLESLPKDTFNQVLIQVVSRLEEIGSA